MTLPQYTPEELKAKVGLIRQKIDDYCLQKFGGDRRTHLGASEVGSECLRQQWYNFRWFRRKQFPPRMYRLFNRGHREEERFVEWLTGAGFTCRDIDPATGKQYVFSEVGGHYGGSTDGIVNHPDLFPGEDLISEYKTHNDKSFKTLVLQGVRKAMPKHYIQMSNYGAKWGIRLGVYCAVNKNDDDLYIEIVYLDWNVAEGMSEKARYLITSPAPPPRMPNASPTFYKCKDCEAIDCCFYKAPPDRNCRSCKFAMPTDNAEWYCYSFQGVIPKDFIAKGCDSWKPLA